MFPPPSRLTRLAACLAVPLSIAALLPTTARPQEGDGAATSLAITSVTVIDVRQGEARTNRTVVIEGDRIVAVGPAESVRVPADAHVVDGGGKFLIPGLWDMHAHATSERRIETFFPLLVANGVTGIRDPWGSLAVADSTRPAVRAGELTGPARIVAAGNLVDGPPGSWPGSQIARSPAAGRHIVDSLHAAGVPFVKVYHSLSAPTYFAIAERARELGLPFVGHVPFTVRAAAASEAGQHSIEHLFGALIGCSSDEEAILAEAGNLGRRFASGGLDAVVGHFLEQSRRAVATQDEARCRRLADRFVENDTWQVPTLVSLRGKAYLHEIAAAGDPRTRFFKPRRRWLEKGPWPGVSLTEEQWGVLQAQYEREKEIVGLMAEAGVPILAGSDTATPWAFPGFGLHDELELLVEAGLTPLQALQAATLTPARFFEATDSLGTVEAGKLADLVLLDGNPLEDISNTREIRTVVVDGRYLDRAALDRLLADAEQAANPPDAAGDSVSSKDRSPAKELQSDTVHVAPPKGEKETDRASILAALEEVEPGGTVLFSPGTYLIGEFLRVEVPRITLQGHPDGTTLRGCDPDDYPPYREQLGRCNGLELATGHVTVRDVTIEHAWHGIYIGCCLKDLARSYLGEGEGPPLAQPGGHLIEDNRLRSVGTAMRVIGEASEPIVIRDNVFRNTAHALVINGGTAHVLDNDIAAPEPERVPSGRHPLGAIVVFPSPPARDCGPNVIAGNRIEGHPDGIGLGVGVPGTRCERNVVRDNTIIVRRVPIGASGQAVRVGSESDSTVVGVPIGVGNVAGHEGVPLPPTWQFEGESVIGEHMIEGNRVQGAEGLGIEIRRSSGNRIVGNVVTHIERRDPFPGNVANSADPEPWREANGSGIWLSPGSDRNEIAGNRFEDIAGAAVYLEGDNNEVRMRNTCDSVRDLGRGNRIVGVQDAEVPRTRTFPGVEETPYPYAQPEEVGLSAERLKELGDRVAGWVRDSSIVGAELLVVKDRKIVLHEAIGWSDREAGEPMRRNTIYRIRSMTKPFTGTAALMLVEEGKLALDAPVSRWFPSWDNERSGEITVRQLLTHTAGWVQRGAPKRWGTYSNLRAVVDDVGEHGPQHAPGTAFRYSDVHSNTLGVLVEEISGLPIEQFIEGRIVEPLGLHDTHIHIRFTPDTAWADRMNPTYQRVDGEWEKYWSPDNNPRTPFFPAAYGLVSTVFDYARWLDTWMRWGHLKDETDPPPSVRTTLTESEASGPATKPLLSEAMVREALTPSSLGPYGLHWDVRSVDPLVFGHGGSDGTDAMAVPSRDLMILYFTQSRNNRTLEPWRREALEAVASDLELDPPVPTIPVAEADLKVVELSAAERDRYVGSYRPRRGDRTAEVRDEDGKLHFKPAAPGAESIPLITLGDHTFALGQYEGDELTTVVRPLLRLRFQIEDGHVSSLRLLRDGEAIGELIRIE